MYPVKLLALVLPQVFPMVPNGDPTPKFSGVPVEPGQYPFLVLITAFYQPSTYYQDPNVDDSYNDYSYQSDDSYEELFIRD